jgi:tRNA A-37 threonylcarbamoyl transferase component Bud32
MHFPRLRAWLQDDRAAARLLETAVRHEQRVVRLLAPPIQGGLHVLEVPLSTGQLVCILAEPVGIGRPDGVTLGLRPTDPVQTPELFALVERLDRGNAPSGLPSGARAANPARVAPNPQSPPQPSRSPAQPTPPQPSVSPAQPIQAHVASPPPQNRAPAKAHPNQAAQPRPAPTQRLPKPQAVPVAVKPAVAYVPPPAIRARAPSLPSPDLYDLIDESPNEDPSEDVDIEVDLDPELDAQTQEDDGPTLFQRAPPQQPDLRTREDARPAMAEPSGFAGVEHTVVLVGTGERPGPTSGFSPRVEEPAGVTAPAAELIGQTIGGKYVMEASLGRGMSGVVYRAQHKALRRAVAVKVLHRENLDKALLVKRFKEEGRTLSKLEHRNIARVLDFGEEPNGLLYLVMELLAGKSLETLLRTEGKLPVHKVLDLGIQTASGLAFAHDEGVIHRDVKPDNIVLVAHRDDDGKPCDVVKVCDFGLAKLRAGAPTSHDSPQGDGEQTMAGAVCGSPSYMAPEQLLGETLDARSDIHALGVTLYEALTGTLPHEGAGLAELFVKKLTGEPTPLRVHLPNVDAGLESTIMRAIAREKSQRQEDARAFRQELRDILARLR